MHLDDELALLSSVFRAAGDRFHLIGHSFGGAIALKAALADHDRLLSLVLYEPVLFSFLIADAPETAAAREIIAVRDDTIRLVDEGNLNAAAQRFVDYWSGDGTWAATPEPRRQVLAAAMRAVKSEWHALFCEPTPLSAFAAVTVPTLFLTGTKSKASALAVSKLVTSVLPRVRLEEIEGVGHMAPVTHPDTVNPLIERFLEAPRDSRHLAFATLSTSPKTAPATYIQQDRVFRPNGRTHNGNPGFMYTCNQFVRMEGLGEDEG